MFLDNAMADDKNYRNIYSKTYRFGMKSPLGPEDGFEYEAFTLNPRKYPNDPRLRGSNLHLAGFRTVNGVKMMFLTDMYGYSLYGYRFSPETDGETAIPVIAVVSDDTVRVASMKQDTDGDGNFDEETVMYADGGGAPGGNYQHLWLGWDVDADGNIWNATAPFGKQTLLRHNYEGLNSNGIPHWSCNTAVLGNSAILPAPSPFNAYPQGAVRPLRMSRYDAENDVMYLTGAFRDDYFYNSYINGQPVLKYMSLESKSPGDTVARYENWSSENRSLAFVKRFDNIGGLYENRFTNLNAGFAVCGDFIFVGESAFTVPSITAVPSGVKGVPGIHIYEAATGNKVGKIEYDRSLGELGLWDIVMPLTAVKLPNNRYMIMIEDDRLSKTVAIVWQAPPAFDDFPPPDFSKLESEGIISVTLRRSAGIPDTADLAFALYDGNNKLKAIRFTRGIALPPAPGITHSAKFENAAPGDKARVFLWNGNMTPLHTYLGSN
jgi:hypothetical protein